MRYFRVKPDSSYAQAVESARDFENQLAHLSAMLRIEINLPPSDYFSYEPAKFYHPPNEIPADLKNYFTKDGFAKRNAFVHKRFQQMVTEADLTGRKPVSITNFTYGMMKKSQRESFIRFFVGSTQYIQTNTQLYEEQLAHLEEITEIEFRETHLKALEEAEKA